MLPERFLNFREIPDLPYLNLGRQEVGMSREKT